MAARDKGVDWQTAKHNSYISKFVEAEDGKYSYVERIQDYKFCSDESDGHRNIYVRSWSHFVAHSKRGAWQDISQIWQLP